MRLLVLTLLVALTGMVVACGQANEAEESSGGGIQVHGHWTVTITDPDGTTASVHEFDNEMTAFGPSLLTALLAGQTQVKSHQLWIIGSGSPKWDCVEQIGPVLSTGGTVIAAIAVRDETAPGNPLMLSGVCTVTELDGAGEVHTVLSKFKPTSAYSYCPVNPVNSNVTYSCGIKAATSSASLTQHVEVIPVANNQILGFNVVFSFE
jgi:hypothetical protein